ncbi:cation transporter [Methanobrevibacter sp. 87.7]|uniref:heavy metal translocating P-type ATPase n=1 Tax=Methanobrevibacter sp. 87.7 TaxID=387957 RepID=UPI000B5108E5|nr:heavy metal translocating P-type ATPase [Methanobrevibacter sp. 87.7]OWT32573.1 cation transporter [Methanobrevibacter sp. 87.7]
MKYEIVYDKGTRLRVVAERVAFTKEEGWGIATSLLDYDFITDVKTSHRNGSILIYYQDRNQRQTILDILDNIKYEDLYEAEPPTNKAKIRELENKFFMQVSKIVIKRYLYKIILPIPIRKLRLFVHAIPYVLKGLDSLTSFNIDVELLDASAITGSLHEESYNSAGSMMFLLSISDLLEEYTMQKTKDTLKDSLALNVDTVWLLKTDEDGNETEISYPLSQVKKGDVIVVRMGSIIPVDGTIVSGDGMINESSMTGESFAVHKNEGKTVHAGTVVEEGTIHVEVVSVNEGTRLNKIVDLIENSEDLKAGIHSKAERLADSIVSYTFLATALTYLFTRDRTKTLSVLMVDFSCAIKLTTPLTIISAMREASDHRMMIKGGKFLENYANADTIVFDKTGTLTNASPKLEKVIPMGKLSRDEVLRISACIEEHFAHSVATAIVNQAKAEGLHHEEDHSEVEYIVAHGIATYYNEKRAIIGSYHFVCEDEGVKFTKKQEKIIKENLESYSVIYLAIAGKLEGILCIDDPVRKEAKEVISELKSLGINNVIMLTGDSENAAKSIANDLGITRYRSQVLPEDKAHIIEEIKAEGNQVIMVGDGINDSPALSAANVSVSMRNSSDIAREVADISLLSDDLYDLVTLRRLSKAMLDKIDDNYEKILWINGTLIVLGVLGLIQPNMSSIIHNLSTMLLGVASTKTVLNDDYDRKEIESPA